MGNPYTSVSVSGYNANPPADDGTQTEANRVKWATVKTKLNDPVKTALESINTNVNSAVGKLIGGASVTDKSGNYTVLSTDQGKLVRATAAGITITTPSATDVGAPFVFAVLNNSAGDIVIDGNGSQTIDGAANTTVPAGGGVTLYTDGTNWYTTGQSFSRTLVRPQGYLTLVPVATDPLSPIPATDQSAKTAVYYRPDGGNLLPIPDGTTITVREFSELTLTLVSNHVANGIYDVYAFDDSGTIRIGTSPIWNTVTAGSCARGTGAGTAELDLLKGVLVNKVAMTLRNGSSTYSIGAKSGVLLGAIYIDGSAGQVSCHVAYGQDRKWGVANLYNRRRITLKAGDSTASWTYNATTIRASNNSAANSASVLACIADQQVRCRFNQNILLTASANNAGGQNWIGWNSTSAGSGKQKMHKSDTTSINQGGPAEYTAPPALGLNVVTALEAGNASVTPTFYGGEDDMILTVEFDA